MHKDLLKVHKIKIMLQVDLGLCDESVVAQDAHGLLLLEQISLMEDSEG